MSNQGSDFRDRYLQEPSAKRAKLSNANAIDPTSGVLRLHTEWVQRDPGDRVTAYVGSPAESPIPVPQSDFEIEINSSNQDGGMSSPGQEISITPTNEPRILTIDNRTDVSLSSHPQDTAVTTTMVTSIPLQAEEIPLETHPSITTSADFSTIISSRGIMDQNQIQVEHQPLTTSGDLNSTPFILSSQSQAPQDGQSTGPLYVMIPPSSGAEILHAMSHTQTPGFSTAPYGGDIPDESRKQKDLVRKQTHNEVERRRRDRINELIKLLAEIVPGCQKKDASNGNIVGYVYSKGTVLEKTVEYVRDLMTQNEQLSAAAKLAEKSASALQVLQNQITVLEKENAFLRAQMIQIGIDTTSGTIAGRNLLPNSLAQSLLNTAQLQAAPPPPSLTTPSNNTTQLLVSLAQSLTNNPLLASLTQASSSTPPANIPAVTQVTPSTQTQVSNSVSPAVATGNSNQANLLSSLVQVLSSMAAPVPPQPPAPIPAAQPQQAGNISATAAMSLINSLLMAQSAINTPTHTTSVSLPSSVANILGDHNTDKATPT